MCIRDRIQRANTILCTRPGKQNRASSYHLQVDTVQNTTRASSSRRSGDLDLDPITPHSYSTLAYPVSPLRIVANTRSITHNTTRKFCACPFVSMGCSDHPLMSTLRWRRFDWTRRFADEITPNCPTGFCRHAYVYWTRDRLWLLMKTSYTRGCP